MSISLLYNSSASFVSQSLERATSNTGRHSQRLSTGVKINSASDDAAGLGLSKKLSAQVSSSDMAKNNAQTGVNLLQTAESDLAQIGEYLQRLRDLSVQSSNGVYSDSERASLDAEFTQLKSEIVRTSVSSSFSDQKLLGSLTTNITLQIGTNNNAEDKFDITLHRGFGTAFLAAHGVETVTDARLSMDALDAAISANSFERSSIGAMVNRLSSLISRTDSRQDNLSAAASKIVDADMAVESAGLTKGQILRQSSVALLQQANQTSGETALTLLRQ